MTTFTLPNIVEAIGRLDNLFATAFSSDDKAMQDYVAMKFALKAAAGDTVRMDWLIKQGPPGAAKADLGFTQELWDIAYAMQTERDQLVMRKAIDAAMDITKEEA